jgi:ABC-2 type transport system permease protein
MRDIWLVVKHDIGATLSKRSFWLLTGLMPLLLIMLNAFLVAQENELRGAENGITGALTPDSQESRLAITGLVDDAGLTVDRPPDWPDDQFTVFSDEVAARTALESGEIDRYVHIPAHYVTTGQLTVYDQNVHILQMDDAYRSQVRSLIEYNMTGDEKVVAALPNPVPGAHAIHHALAPDDANRPSEVMGMVVASIMPYIYYFVLIMGGSYLLRSVVAEKENRTAEVLLLSLAPKKLMVGKILAMSVVMLIQVGVWVIGAILVLNLGADLMKVASFSFPPGFWVWASLFLVLGYLLYASVMAAAGAIAPNAREGNQVIGLLIIPLMPTLMFGRVFMEEPHGTLSVVLSLFPLSAPSAMVTRLAISDVPLWQVLASAAGLALTAYLFVTLSSRFFRSDNLLSHESFNWRRLATGWRRRGV